MSLSDCVNEDALKSLVSDPKKAFLKKAILGQKYLSNGSVVVTRSTDDNGRERVSWFLCYVEDQHSYSIIMVDITSDRNHVVTVRSFTSNKEKFDNFLSESTDYYLYEGDKEVIQSFFGYVQFWYKEVSQNDNPPTDVVRLMAAAQPHIEDKKFTLATSKVYEAFESYIN